VLAAAALDDENFGQNPTALAFKVLQPGRYYAFGSLRHPRSGRIQDPLPYEEQARRLVAMGCDGIKMLEGKPTSRKQLDLPLDAPQLDPYYSFLEKKRVPLLFHVADPETFWDPEHATEDLRRLGWYYGDGGFAAKELLYGEVENVLGKHPRLRVVFAHFYFLSADLDRLAAFFARWPQANVDITPGGEMYVNFSAQHQKARDFFIRFQDRIFFGTDNAGGRRSPDPERTASAKAKIDAMRRFLETEDTFEFWGMRWSGLGLPPEVCAKIYAGNFLRWAGAEPKAVDRLAACEECDRILTMAELARAPEETVASLKATRWILAGH
jgi:predicted TIM-barrel fold metal-dependent hydrolase